MKVEVDALLFDDEQQQIKTNNKGRIPGISRDELKQRIADGEPTIEIPVEGENIKETVAEAEK